MHADVTAMRHADLGSEFRLLLDTGTFHGLSDAQREAMGTEVSAVAAPTPPSSLTASRPGAEAPSPAVRAAPTSSGPSPAGRSPTSRWRTPRDALARLMKFDERFYRLRRTS